MFVYTTQHFNKGVKIHVCLQCLEDAGHKENSFSVEPINWQEHTEATCTICGKTEHRFAMERSQGHE